MGFSYNEPSMPIIKDYHFEDDYEDAIAPKKPFGTLLKAASLGPMQDVVTPSQFSTEISYREPADNVFAQDLFESDHDPVDVAPEPALSSVPEPTMDESNIRQEIESGLKANVDDLVAAINGLKKARDEVVQSSEAQLIDLSMSIAEKIVQKQIEMDPTVIKSVVEDTFNKISGSDRITFKINPEDAAIFNDFQPYIESRLIGVEKITIQHDGSIAQGGCIIETDLGFVDVTIREKLNIIAQTFKKIKATL
jgi:hypothetical protein